MNNFNYLQPQTLAEASKLLKKSSSNSIALAGGTDVLGLIKNNIKQPNDVVNLKAIKSLYGIKYTPGKEVHIGTLENLFDIASNPIIKEKFTALSEAANYVASPQFRNIATLGGNLCQRPRCMYFRKESVDCLRKGGDECYAYSGNNKYHCIVGGGPCCIVHPSDTAVALLAMDAKVSIFSEGKSKVIPLKDFFILPDEDFTKENILKPGEIIEKIIIPELPAGSKSKFVKFMEREAWDFAIVSVAAVVAKKQNRLDSVQLGFGGIAPIPWRKNEIDSEFKGIESSENAIKQVTDQLFPDAELLDMNGYKLPLIRNLTKRLLLEI